jgi:arabinogalactan oligomer/maltooligosaccharide transport system substrate-binding protein
VERKVLIAVVLAVVVVVAALSLYVFVLSGPPPSQQPTHVYAVEGDSEWFDLPAGLATNVSALVTDNGAPLFGTQVNVTVAPASEGTLSSASSSTDTSGIARFMYTAYNRSANVTLTFTFRAVVGSVEKSGTTEVLQLAFGFQPTSARVKGLVLHDTDRLPITNATIQVNLRDATGLPAGTLSFYSNNSDAQGRYVVKDVPPRDSLIQIFKAGYKSQHQNITLTAGHYTRVTFLMEQLTGKVLTIWHTYSGKEQDEFNKMVDRYRATRPDLNVQVEFQPFAGAPEKFIVAATAGNAPDVMRFQNDRLGEVASLGYLEPLDSRLDPATIQRFTPATLAAMRIEGSVYALPATQDLLAIIYNKALFDAKGEPYPSDTWTSNDLVRIATNLTTSTQYGFVTPQTIGFYWFPWLTGYGGQIFTVPDTSPIAGDADIGLNTPEAAKSVLFMQSLDKVDHLMFSNPGEDPMLTDFLQGKAAMITTGPWNIPAIERAQIDYDIALYPIMSDTGLRAKPVLGVKGFGIWKLSSVKDDAFDFLKFMTSPEQQKMFALGVGGVPGTNDIPTYQAAFTDSDILANPVIARFLLQASYSSEFPSRPEMANVWGPLADALTFIYNDVTHPADPANSASVLAAQTELTNAEQQIYG